MPQRELNPNDLPLGDDWVGNNAAFTCPLCGCVFLVSNGSIGGNPLPGHEMQGVRRCPRCNESTARITGGAAQFPQNAQASIEW